MQINTKFDIGQKVYFIHKCNESSQALIIEGVVDGCSIAVNQEAICGVSYFVKYVYNGRQEAKMGEFLLHKSVESLLKQLGNLVQTLPNSPTD